MRDVDLVKRLNQTPQFTRRLRGQGVEGEFENRAFVGRVEGIAQRAAATAGERKTGTMGYPRPLPKGSCYRAGPEPVTFQTSDRGREHARAACKTRL